MSVLLDFSVLGVWLMVTVLLLPLMVGVCSDLLPAQDDRDSATTAKMENAVFMGTPEKSPQTS